MILDTTPLRYLKFTFACKHDATLHGTHQTSVKRLSRDLRSTLGTGRLEWWRLRWGGWWGGWWWWWWGGAYDLYVITSAWGPACFTVANLATLQLPTRNPTSHMIKKSLHSIRMSACFGVRRRYKLPHGYLSGAFNIAHASNCVTLKAEFLS